MTWKKVVASVLAATLAFALAGCGRTRKRTKPPGTAIKSSDGLCRSSMTETMNRIAAQYQKEHPDVEISFNFDSSGTLKTQIQNGADCDLFISAAQKQMNQLDASKDAKANPDKLDFVKSGSRIDLLENKVVLVTPEGNPKGVQNFNDMAAKLKDGSIRLVMGNSDVPVGQYTQRILKFYNLE